MRQCGALAKILPEVEALFGVPQSPAHHPEIDTGIHTLLAVVAAQQLTTEPKVIFAVLTHDLGKALTAADKLPKHHGHEKAGLVPLANLCERLAVPQKYFKLAKMVCKYHLHHHRIRELKPSTILTLLENLDGFRQPDNVKLFGLCCVADLRGRPGREHELFAQTELLYQYHRAAKSVDAAAIARNCENGQQIKQQLRTQRIIAIEQVKCQLN